MIENWAFFSLFAFRVVIRTCSSENRVCLTELGRDFNDDFVVSRLVENCSISMTVGSSELAS